MNEVPTVAIIDDDPSLRRSLLRVVESAGYKGEAFPGGREFFEWLASGRPACLVVDVHMEEMTGFEVQERLAVPLIFITAHDDPATRARIATSGAPHLYKPFDGATLLRAIRQAVHRS
jgi:FixJ family two-component response regulator